MADKTKETEAHPLVGLPDGHINDQDEKIVYEYDEDGNFVGWHKEVESK